MNDLTLEELRKESYICPGVVDIFTYIDHRTLRDKKFQSISLDAEFYEGEEVRLFPKEWLQRAAAIGDRLDPNRRTKYLGVDSAQGGDNSCWSEGDDLGLLKLTGIKTSNTNNIPTRTASIIRANQILPENVLFDRGGGGKEHADLLRSNGFNVRTIAFGETATDPNEYDRKLRKDEQRNNKEFRYVYKNKRSELYGLASSLLSPVINPKGYGIPSSILHRPRSDNGPSLYDQLRKIPLWYDKVGRLILPPKIAPSDKQEDQFREVTLKKLLGCSPDEADAFVLMLYAKLRPKKRSQAGGF